MRNRAGEPLGQRDFATLKDGLDRDGELLAAAIALVQAGAMRIAFQAWSAQTVTPQ